MALHIICSLLGLLHLSCPVSKDRASDAHSKLPNTTLSGYLTIADGAQMFYAYYESEQAAADAPIVVWLQGGPGCASNFGSFYELGPQTVSTSLQLVPNPGAWNRQAALLFVDQPVGVGFSIAGSHGIPENELEMAADLYVGLQRFFKLHPHLARRPMVIAGESYAGKYVPSIGHFVLQQEQLPAGPAAAAAAAPAASNLEGGRQGLRHARSIPQGLYAGREELREAPIFRLRGLVIGNGLTAPEQQVGTHADVAFSMGLLDELQRDEARAMQARVQSLIADGQWDAAHEARGQALEFIANAAGAATLLDVRRFEDYDAGQLVDAYLNQAAVKEALGVPADLHYESCSEEVGSVLGRDVMKSVACLVPDLLDAYPLLLFQGQFDVQDGPASTEAWLDALEWAGRPDFLNASRSIVRGRDILSSASCAHGGKGPNSEQAELEGPGGGPAAGRLLRRRLLAPGAAEGSAGGRAFCEGVQMYWKAAGKLTHVVVRGAGHMPPRDNPSAAQYMIERWLGEALAPRDNS